MPWDERKWDGQRQALIRADSEQRNIFFDPVLRDPHFWLRQEVEYPSHKPGSNPVEGLFKKRSLQVRLIAAEPKLENYAYRATFHSGSKQYDLAIRDAFEAGQRAGVWVDPFSWPADPASLISNQAGLPQEHYELAIRWEKSRGEPRVAMRIWVSFPRVSTASGDTPTLSPSCETRKSRVSQPKSPGWSSPALPRPQYRCTVLPRWPTPTPSHPHTHRDEFPRFCVRCAIKSSANQPARQQVFGGGHGNRAKTRRSKTSGRGAGGFRRPAGKEIPFYSEAAELITGKKPSGARADEPTVRTESTSPPTHAALVVGSVTVKVAPLPGPSL